MLLSESNYINSSKISPYVGTRTIKTVGRATNSVACLKRMFCTVDLQRGRESPSRRVDTHTASGGRGAGGADAEDAEDAAGAADAAGGSRAACSAHTRRSRPSGRRRPHSSRSLPHTPR